MRLHDLRAPLGATHKRKRVGRGESSGHGKTAGRGGKGQTARTGKGKPRRGFEGGQVPMYRRMPKRGFRNIFALETAAVNLDTLASFFVAGSTVDLDAVISLGLASRTARVLRVLGRGKLDIALTVRAHHVTETAKAAIESVGGQVFAFDA